MSTQPTLKSWSIIIPAAKRFVVLADFNNEAVLDRETGLVWEKTPDTIPPKYTAEGARFFCRNKTVGGRKGWRLPTAVELSSLVDPSVAVWPPLPIGHPFVLVKPTLFWSATVSDSDIAMSNGLIMNFSDGTLYANLISNGYGAWCVRGGMNADQY